MDNPRRFETRLVILVTVAALGTPLGAQGLHHSKTSSARVDCARGESINIALRHAPADKAIVLNVRGACNENVIVTRNDVTLLGEPGASIVALDPGLPAVSLNGAHRASLTGLTFRGGVQPLHAFGGTTADVRNCVVENGTRFGVVANYGSTVTVDGCTIRNNASWGALAANSSNLIVTNSTVESNGGGLLSIRNSQLRVGQDADGGPAPGPVVVRGNTNHGIAITETAAGLVIAATIENNTGQGVAVSYSSNASIGIGSSNIASPVTIRGNGSHGVSVFQASRGRVHASTVEANNGAGIRIEGSSGTVTASTVRANTSYGISVLNGGNARIGFTDNTTPAGNLIEDNVFEGVHVVSSSSAWMYGNTIRRNSLTNGRWGVLAVDNSNLRLVGQNRIEANGSIVGSATGGGVFVRGSGLNMYQGDFTTTPNTNIVVGNAGNGILATENSTIEARDDVVVTGNSRYGVFLIHGSRMRGEAPLTVSDNATGGIHLLFGSSARFGPGVSVSDPVTCADGESSVVGIPAACSGF